MKTSKQLKQELKLASQQQIVIGELQSIARDIERCENNIIGLQKDLEQVNARHSNRQSTQDDVNYLEDLLACAKRKLVWEKHIASLQKRTPELMKRVEEIVNHPESNPDEQTKTALLQSLNNVKAAMERLHSVKR